MRKNILSALKGTKLEKWSGVRENSTLILDEECGTVPKVTQVENVEDETYEEETSRWGEVNKSETYGGGVGNANTR